MPDLGASALGRGGAFAARADDGLALHYNVAGFAQQRGTRVMLSANVISRTYTYSRPGSYPDPATDPLTPWGGKPFPLVQAESKPTPVPLFALSTDLGIPRLVFFSGVSTPSPAVGGMYPLGVADGKPNPARYQTVLEDGVFVYPTLGASYRVTDDFDVGIAGHFVYGSIDVFKASILDSSKKTCPNTEYQPCDLIQHIVASGVTGALSAGALVRLSRNVTAGVSARTAQAIPMRGNVTIKPPKTVPANEDTAPMTLTLRFPWVARAGLRYAAIQDREEQWDIEVDGSYEAWSGSRVTNAFVPKASFVENIDASVDNGYTDTASVRVGGSFRVSHEATIRAGLFHETSGLPIELQRVGMPGVFPKFGLAGGVSYQTGPVRLTAAYAAVLSPDRTVTEGRVFPGNVARRSLPYDSSDGVGAQYPATNLGTHSTHAHVVALSVDVAFGQTQ